MTVGFALRVLGLIVGTFACGAIAAFVVIVRHPQGLNTMWKRERLLLRRIRDLARQLSQALDRDAAHCRLIEHQRNELAALRVANQDLRTAVAAAIVGAPLGVVHQLPAARALEGAAL